MTFENTAWAIDGSLLSSSLARRAEFAAVSGAQGIVQRDDLKVSQLNVPGVGVQIAPGVGLVTNNYQDSPNETYVVSNPGVHTIPSVDMPAANPSAKSYIVAVVVGDPDFTQAGHPWMGSDDPPEGEEQTFQYVRVTLIEVSAGATTLPADYPAIPLARLDIPASTTTITNAMIVDLRKLARPRQEQTVLLGAPWTNASPQRIPSATAFADWGATQYSPSVAVPSWAKRAIVIAKVNGVRLADSSVNIAGYIRAQLGTVSGPSIAFDMPVGSGAVRVNLESAGVYDVSAIAGTNAILRIEGYENVPASPTTNQRLALQSGTQMIFDIRFFEE